MVVTDVLDLAETITSILVFILALVLFIMEIKRRSKKKDEPVRPMCCDCIYRTPLLFIRRKQKKLSSRNPCTVVVDIRVRCFLTTEVKKEVREKEKSFISKRGWTEIGQMVAHMQKLTRRI